MTLSKYWGGGNPPHNYLGGRSLCPPKFPPMSATGSSQCRVLIVIVGQCGRITTTGSLLFTTDAQLYTLYRHTVRSPCVSSHRKQ